MQFRIRPANKDDAKHLVSLVSQLGYESSPSQIESRVPTILNQQGHAVWVAEFEGTLIGWIHAFIAYRVESDPFVEIGGLVVAADFQHKGVGRGLVSAVEHWVHQSDLTTLRVRSNIKRSGALNFYTNLGFEEVKVQRVFERVI